METAKKLLDSVLETHFCDLDVTKEHESKLFEAVEGYFSFFDIFYLSKVMDSLADKKRLKIFHLLSLREMCNCELSVALKTSQPNLSYHVKRLEEAGLVLKRRDGKFIYYSLKETPIINLFHKLLTATWPSWIRQQSAKLRSPVRVRSSPPI